LDGTGGVETHNEVVALAVSSLVLGGDLGEAEGTPVGEAPNNTTGADNVANGFEAMTSNTSGSNGLADGWEALFSQTTGIHNVALGSQAAYSTTSGNSNTASGVDAEHFHPGPSAAAASLPDGPKVMFTGRLHPQKNLDVLKQGKENESKIEQRERENRGGQINIREEVQSVKKERAKRRD